MRERLGFTLIELLVTMAVIAILAALVIPASRSATAARTRARAKSELKEIETYIELYKISMNFYPPSNSTVGRTVNPLYYELAGTRFNQGVFTTLDNSTSVTAGNVFTAFGVTGFANSIAGSSADEGSRQPQNFFRGALRFGQYMEVSVTNEVLRASSVVVVLGSQVRGPVMLPGTRGGGLNPFGYNSLSPTNNPNSYELWLDITLNGAPTRICNWSLKPIRL